MANLTAGTHAVDMRQPGYGLPSVAGALDFLDSFDLVRTEVVTQSSTYFEIRAYDSQNNLVIEEGTGDLASGTLNSLTVTIPSYQVRLNLTGSMYVDSMGNTYGSISEIAAYRTVDNGLLAQLTEVDLPLDADWVGGLSDPGMFAGNDALQGSPDADYLIGYGGADTIAGGSGDDSIEGGQGGRTPQERLPVTNPTPESLEPNGSSTYPAISGDGRFIAFASQASNLTGADGDAWQDVFVRDTGGGAIHLASAPEPGGDPYGFSDGPVAISDDGRYVAFSYAGSLLPDLNTSATGYLFLRDLIGGGLTCVSLTSDGQVPNGSNWHPDLSADGRYVAFMTYATDLVDDDLNSDYDIVVRDNLTNTLIHASTSKEGAQANGSSIWPSISADGRFVAFASSADNLVPNDGNGHPDTFVKDIWSGDVARVSTTSPGDEGNGNSGGIPPSISADGRFVTFASEATNLVPGDTNGHWDVFVKDLRTGQLSLVSAAADGEQGDGDSFYASISGDGRYVAFTSSATNLLAEASGSIWTKLLVKDVLTGAIASVVPTDGTPMWLGNDLFPVISADGRYIAFSSESGSLTAPDTNYAADIFRFENPFTTAVAPDSLDGGAGTDTAIYPGTLSRYAVSATATDYSVDDVLGLDGADTVAHVERLRFSDMTVNLTVQEATARLSSADLSRLEELYVAFFNRVPDADGLEYWIGRYQSGMTINEMAESFYDAGLQYSELTGYSPGMTNAEFVDVVYRNVLGREDGADPEGLAYWTGELAAGRETHGSLVSTILDSAHTFEGDPTWGWVADLLDNKIAVANEFSVAWGLNYNTPEESIARGMAIAAAITPTSTDAAIALIGVEPGQIDLTA